MDEEVRDLLVPIPGSYLSPEAAMKLAISEAYRGAPHVSPNPQVGCVILDSLGHFLASGYHERFGGPHAEINALKKVSEADLRGAVIYVTLEPCAHEGKTPSCAKTLAKYPLAKVVYGVMDPNPQVSGKGIKILAEAGIPCVRYEEAHDSHLQTSLEEVCETFLWNYRHQKTFVALKIATSLDGRIALADGSSQWITGEKSRETVHELRAAFDAVMVGAGTVEKDNPSLDVRHSWIQKRNKAVVLDPEGKLLPKLSQLNLRKSHEPQEIIWIVGESAKAECADPIQILKVPVNGEGYLSLPHVMTCLWETGLRSVFVEGGAQLAGQLLTQNLINRLYLFQAPILMGGQGALSWTEALKIPSMDQKRLVAHGHRRFLGADIFISGLLRKPLDGDQYRTV